MSYLFSKNNENRLDIANIFFRAGEIEAWGHGIHRIFEACRDAGTPEPRLSFETGEFLAEFAFSPQYLELLGVVSRRCAKTQVETRVKTPEAILMLLRKNPTMTLEEVAGIREQRKLALDLRRMRKEALCSPV